MSPEEIKAHAESVGVMVLRKEVRIVEPTQMRGYAKRVIPMRMEYSCCEPVLSGFSVLDGMCRAGRSDWLPWENWGKTWCFLDDCIYEMESHDLKEAMHEYQNR